MDEPPVQEKVHINFKLLMYCNQYRHVLIKKLLRIMDGLNVHYITPRRKIVLWYERTRLIWTSCHLGMYRRVLQD